jgi:hypothetical protein
VGREEDRDEYDKQGPLGGGVYREFSSERVLDFNKLLLAISF